MSSTKSSDNRIDDDNSKATRMEVLRLWKLPNDFFALPLETQRLTVQGVIIKAPRLDRPRSPCPISLVDDGIAIIFFLVTLGLPLVLVLLTSIALIAWKPNWLLNLLIATIVLALHPMPSRMNARHSRLALALIRYFSMEILLDQSNPLVAQLCSPTIETTQFQEDLLPLVCLACPHGVFNYGAIIWCCISRWVVGWEQYTGAAAVVQYVPGLRYMDRLIWSINADRKSIQNVLRQRGPGRTGGMLGMVPDGILGAFRCRNGVDELMIGKKRGLMRICAQEGATIIAAWMFGTTDMMTVVSDPWGIMETVSRKLQAGMLIAYGRFGLPVPRRIAVTLSCHIYKVPEKLEQPIKEQVDAIHDEVYGGLQKVYEKQRVYAGYTDRTLIIS